MKKVIAWLLVLALTAAVSIGATLAYLTDTDEDVNVMTLGKVKIDQLEYERVDVESKDKDATVQEFHDNKPLLPAVTDKDFKYTPGTSYVDWEQIGKDGYTSEIWDPTKINNEVDKMVFIKNKGDYDAYVRSVFAFEAGKYTTLNQFKQMVHLNLNETDYTWEWLATPVTIGESTYFVATATYNKVLAPGALTEISLSQIALDSSATNEDVEAFGETYQVLVKTQGIQADGFTDADTALNEGFGVIDADNIPWENDNPTLGVDLNSAVHFLQGDRNGTQISGQVVNLIFGYEKDHADIVENYKGTLVDVEQDVPAYAYYVPKDGMYDVYVLSNDTIYAPANCGSMFSDMNKMTTVDTTNFDVSRTTDMNKMFYNCSSLTNLDVSEWDTSSVTNMEKMFRGAKSPNELDVSKWNTSNVTNMCQVFMGLSKLTTIDVTNWDTSKVVDMRNMFWNCDGITSLDLSNWDVSNVKDFEGMFADMSNVTYVDMTGWTPTSAETMYSLFYECTKLQSANMNGWQLPHLTTTSHMFRGCNNMSSVDVRGWYTPSLTSMDAMFHTCKALTEVDLSSFDTSNCTELSQIFEYATGIKQIKGLEKWDTSSCKTFEQAFAGCYALEELNLSSFNTRNVENAFYPMQNGSTGWGYKEMFSDMSNRSLKKLILGENFSFDGDGKVTTDSYKVILPSPAAKEGYIGKWQNVETGVVYDASEIPEETAATYVAYYEYVSKGAKMIDALHYLNANPSGTKITSSVNSVTFGLMKDYPDIVNNYTGTLADAEQELPTYAYYVKNGSTYDIYVLSDGTIYAPANSKNLFASMGKLTKVKGDLDVSRVTTMESMFDYCSALQSVDSKNWKQSKNTNMAYMFYGCGSLTDLDTSGWDLSSVTSMNQTFFSCSKLATLDVSNWDISNVDFLYATFYNCSSLTKLDTANWDTSKVANMSSLFSKCTKLAELDVSGWDVSKVTTFLQTFSYCPALTSLDVSNWDTSSATRMDSMFYADYNLETLDVSNWDVSNVTLFNHLFASDNQNGADMKLKNVDVSKWNPVKAVNMGSLFYGCGQLESVDMSNWNMPNLENLTHAFADCHKLKEVKMTGWNTPALISADAMFNHCMALESIDVSDLDTATIREFSQMFEACTSLKEIIGMNKWDTSSGCTFTEMFNATNSLKVLDLSAWNTGSAYDNYKTYAGDSYPAFTITFTGMTSLEKLIIGENVSFRGNGTISEANQMSLPAPAAKAGFTAKWQNVDTGVLYDANQIPEKVAATYVAYYIPNP